MGKCDSETDKAQIQEEEGVVLLSTHTKRHCPPVVHTSTMGLSDRQLPEKPQGPAMVPLSPQRTLWWTKGALQSAKAEGGHSLLCGFTSVSLWTEEGYSFRYSLCRLHSGYIYY